MNAAASEQRKRAASLTSAIAPGRPSGVLLIARSREWPTRRRFTPSVSATGPGAIPLTHDPVLPPFHRQYSRERVDTRLGRRDVQLGYLRVPNVCRHRQRPAAKSVDVAYGRFQVRRGSAGRSFR